MACPQPQYAEDCLRLYADSGQLLACCPCFRDCSSPDCWNGDDGVNAIAVADIMPPEAEVDAILDLFDHDRCPHFRDGNCQLRAAATAFVREYQGAGSP